MKEHFESSEKKRKETWSGARRERVESKAGGEKALENEVIRLLMMIFLSSFSTSSV
jgi:hypothetical protein